MKQFSHSELEHLTNYWCRTLDIHSKDLTEHPQIDDVILLIKFIKEFLQELRSNYRIQVYIIWDWVYQQRRPITKKYLKKLNRIGNCVLKNRYFKQKEMANQRKKIKAITRTLPE